MRDRARGRSRHGRNEFLASTNILNSSFFRCGPALNSVNISWSRDPRVRLHLRLNLMRAARTSGAVLAYAEPGPPAVSKCSSTTLSPVAPRRGVLTGGHPPPAPSSVQRQTLARVALPVWPGAVEARGLPLPVRPGPVGWVLCRLCSLSFVHRGAVQRVVRPRRCHWLVSVQRVAVVQAAGPRHHSPARSSPAGLAAGSGASPAAGPSRRACPGSVGPGRRGGKGGCVHSLCMGYSRIVSCG